MSQQQLTMNDLNELKGMGFSEGEILEAMKEIEQEELQKSYNSTRTIDPRTNSQHSAFMTKADESLMRWQLELNDILERAEHIFRGDKPKFIDGQMIWEKNDDPDLNCLNERGIMEFMKILSMYVNRNTILSDYENDEIRDKMLDFGKRVNNLLFMKAEEFGIDTDEKEKMYEILVGELVDIVHSTYKRALKGGERRSLREMINISQNMNSGLPNQNGQSQGMNGATQTRGVLNPMRYVKGKYI